MSHGLTNNDSMFSVREMPWHGLGVVLDQYPRSIDEALEKAGLGWQVTHGDVLVVKHPEWIDDFGSDTPPSSFRPRGSMRTCARTPARSSGSCRTSTRWSITGTRFGFSTR